MDKAKSTFQTKVGLAEMLKGGVIMDVVTADQARIAEDAGAAAVMALERVPATIRKDGGVARASDPAMIKAIQQTVSIPVMAKCRIGHFMEARILEALEVDYVDESEVLTPADERFHIDKHAFKVPFVCGCRNLGEALRRIGEGAALMRTKGEAGTGNIVEAVRHLRDVRDEVRQLTTLDAEQLMDRAKQMGAPHDLVRYVASEGRLPVPNFAAGGVATPADAALCMALGAESVFVGSAIFLSEDPKTRARAIVEATTHWQDAKKLAEISAGLGAAMPGIELSTLTEDQTSGQAGLVVAHIGVLALQGGFEAHERALRRLGHTAVQVRAPGQLEGLAGLILPGGESTTQLKLIHSAGLEDELHAFVRAGKPALATCAGMILAARRVLHPEQPSLGWIDVVVERNAYGRQLDSFEAVSEGGLPLVFIRAPRIRELGPEVQVLDRLKDEPILVRHRGLVGATFHPELTDSLETHVAAFGAG